MTQRTLKNKLASKLKRKKKVRSSLHGTSQRPRLSVFRSNRFFYAQAIDDDKATTLIAVDGAKEGLKSNKEDAKKAAELLAKRLKDKKIDTVIFDRNGYLYHGVVEVFASELRNQSIKV